MALINKLPLEIDALSLLAEALNYDFASKGLDEPLTSDELKSMQGILGIRDGVLKDSGKSNPSARDFVTFSGRGQVHDAIVGGPKEIADRLEEMFVERGCDGFVIAATIVPGSYADFVKHIVPELQRRGLFHKDYAGKTLRENLGLKRPAAGAWKSKPRDRGGIRKGNKHMRWLKFTAAGETSWGIVEGDKVFAVAAIPSANGSARRAIARAERRQDRTAADAAHLLLRRPQLPQASQGSRRQGRHGAERADRPEIGYRAQNALIAHDEDVVIPATATEKIHYEGELVVVIGKKAKHLTERDAMSCVFGYTIGNDVSERSWQKADRGLWRAKNADTFKPMGPWIETDVDLDRMETIIKVNGKETGRFRTNDMIFGIVPFIVELTKYFTLWPGDVIWMGTDGASPDLKAGDVVEIDITGIGTLRNKFVAETPIRS